MKSFRIFSILLLLFFSVSALSGHSQSSNYGDQKFSISQFKVIQNQKKDGVSGILVSFVCKTLLGKQDMLPQDTGVVDTDYHLFLNILWGNELLFTPEKSPSEMIWQQSTTRYSIHSASQAGKIKTHSFFIANNKLALGKGNYPLTFKLMACNGQRTYIFDSLYSQKVEITQPSLWTNQLEVENLLVEHRDDWDVAGRNIPFWGIFYGANSDAGNGYPDVIWKVLVGKDVVYVSDINKDSFTGFDGSMTFSSCNGDEVTIIVYDSDLDFDDFIGSYTIPQSRSKDEVSLVKKDIRFNAVEKLTLSFQKSLLPIITRKDINLTYDVKENGVSGVLVSLEYAGDHISPMQSVEIRGQLNPLQSTSRSSKNRAKISNATRTLDPLIFTATEPQGTVNMFIPYCNLSGNEIVNFSFTDINTGLIVSRVGTATTLDRRAIHDINYTLPKFSEVMQYGVKGVVIELQQSVPDYYINKYGGTIRLKTTLTNSDDDQLFKSAQCDSAYSNERRFFIPWADFSNYTNANNNAVINIERNSYLMNNAAIENSIGQSTDKLQLSVPSLFGLTFNEAKINLSKKYQKNYVFALLHGNDTIMMNEGSLKGKTMYFSINTNLTVYHPDDELKILLMDRNNPENNLTVTKCTGKDLPLLNNKTIKNKNKAIKKVYLSFSIKPMNK